MQLDGKNSYTVTFPKGQLPPVKGFWSMTLYNEHHLFTPNPLNRYSLGTKSKSLQYNPDGLLTLYFGAKSPGKDRETNWVPAPDGAFSLYIHAYWVERAILDGSWMPPNVEKVAWAHRSFRKQRRPVPSRNGGGAATSAASAPSAVTAGARDAPPCARSTKGSV